MLPISGKRTFRVARGQERQWLLAFGPDETMPFTTTHQFRCDEQTDAERDRDSHGARQPQEAFHAARLDSRLLRQG